MPVNDGDTGGRPGTTIPGASGPARPDRALGAGSGGTPPGAGAGAMTDLSAYLTGSCEAFRAFAERLAQAAASEATVLLQGESGVGKGQAARALHALGARVGGAYEVVGLASLAPTLVESALFGHERGAFTGAERSHRGFFRRADGGTLVLDDVDLLPPATQGKLLRVLQERLVEPLGAEEPQPVDVRVVATTNRDLRALAEEGSFRQDLYYRLAVIKVRMPALRQRPEDIPLLVRHFLELAGAEDVQVGFETMQRLQAHRWPGNARELKNYVERAVVLAEHGRLETRHLSTQGMPDDAGVRAIPGGEGNVQMLAVDYDLPFKDAKSRLLDTFERRYWTRLLEETEGNVSEAARRGGIHRKSLEYLVKKLDLKG